ncbi:hypothetical protein PMZ80_011002 [Knufia obscura]|uniref:Uncharacterized protein n=1 Tax=Knufia obscura TaxID=1635080 RepID=A0ABR0R968_9EURO|nr:hypothetical protein PMZ80_011002 [Knufia obscura]
MKNSSPTFDNLSTTSSSEHAGVHIITMHKPPKNRLNSAYAQTIIRALRHIERDLVKPSQPGHTFGGVCPFALSCDYRVMNSKCGFLSMPPVNLGLHFEGIGALPRLKLGPRIARKMLLEAHKWTGKEAFADGIVDAIAEPGQMLEVACKLAAEQALRASMGVYGLLRSELWGEALEKFKRISYTHRKKEGTEPKAKI